MVKDKGRENTVSKNNKPEREALMEETCQVEVQIRLSGGGPRPGVVERSGEERKKRGGSGEEEVFVGSRLAETCASVGEVPFGSPLGSLLSPGRSFPNGKCGCPHTARKDHMILASSRLRTHPQSIIPFEIEVCGIGACYEISRYALDGTCTHVDSRVERLRLKDIISI